MPHKISYSDGSTVEDAVVQIWDDNHTERRGNWFRAFWCASPEATHGSPVVGYCSPGGSFRTIRQAALDVRRRYPHDCPAIFRNGRPVKIF